MIAAPLAKRQQIVVLIRGKAFGLNQQTGCDDPDHLATNDSLGLLRVFNLLADGHLVAGLNQFCYIRGNGVVRDTAERNFVAAPLVAGGKGDVEDARGDKCVIQEHLVKIPHAEKKDRIRVSGLDLQVLAHHGGLFCHLLHASLAGC